jgi:hypothetical protein
VNRLLVGALLLSLLFGPAPALAARSDCMVNGEFTPQWTAFNQQCLAEQKCSGRANAVCGKGPSNASQGAWDDWTACRREASHFEDQCFQNCTRRTMTKFDCFKP